VDSLFPGSDKPGVSPPATSRRSTLGGVVLAKPFQARFTGLDVSVLWSFLFDPLFATCDHMNESEKATAFYLTAQEIESICFARDQQAAGLSVVSEVQAIDCSECSSSSDNDQSKLGLGKPTKRRS
jgi:hypothetical protein